MLFIPSDQMSIFQLVIYNLCGSELFIFGTIKITLIKRTLWLFFIKLFPFFFLTLLFYMIQIMFFIDYFYFIPNNQISILPVYYTWFVFVFFFLNFPQNF